MRNETNASRLRHRKRIGKAALLAACLMMLTAIGRSAVLAVELMEPCTVTTSLANSEFSSDLAGTDLVIDLYKVADAVAVPNADTYNYAMTETYSSLTIGAERNNEVYEALTQAAAKIAVKNDVPVVKDAPFGTPITTTSDGGELLPGLYLMLAHQKDLADYVTVTVSEESGEEVLTTVANSSLFEYHFSPELISLPTKEMNGDGIIRDDTPGPWLYEMDAHLKAEREERFGSLRIVKDLLTYETTEETLFVFDVTAVKNGEVVYSDVATLFFNAAGEKSTLIENIPAGAQVTVKEVYSGAHYVLTSAEEQTTEIKAADIVSVKFENDYDITRTGGHGIVNKFEYMGEDGWTWEKETVDTAE